MSSKQPDALRLADEVDEVAQTYPDMAEVSAELRRLHALNQELVTAARQLSMWLPIVTEMSGLDPEETRVEFSGFPDNAPPITISIASSLQEAADVIAKATGDT